MILVLFGLAKTNTKKERGFNLNLVLLPYAALLIAPILSPFFVGLAKIFRSGTVQRYPNEINQEM